MGPLRPRYVLLLTHSLLLRWFPFEAALYVVFLAALIYEPIQRSLIYLHHVRIPRKADFSHPERYGFAPGKVRPFTLTTSDNATLGAWLVLPQSKYLAATVEGVPEDGALPESVFDEALQCAFSLLALSAPAVLITSLLTDLPSIPSSFTTMGTLPLELPETVFELLVTSPRWMPRS
jgi:hypothetical protein